MNPIIQALVVTTVIQIVAMFGMSAFIYDRSTDQARLYAAELVMHYRSEVQQQFSEEREAMKLYVDRTVERKIIQSQHTGDK